jgi:hypothetical protein
MKKLMVKLFILSVLVLSTNAAFPVNAAHFDGTPIPTCDPNGVGRPQCPK